MTILTGETVYEQILSVNADNSPVTGATFDIAIYKDGDPFTGVTVSVGLADSTRGVYTAEWSASTLGDYQLYAKNNSTNVIFVSDTVTVSNQTTSSGSGTTVYVGL